MNDIEIFLNKRNHAPKSDKVSVLEPFKDEIFQLKNMGYAEKIIVEFLSEMKGVKISRQALNLFIRSRSPQMQNVPAQTPQIAPISVSTTPTTTETAENAPTTPVRRGLRKPTPTKKFNWDEKIDPETLK